MWLPGVLTCNNFFNAPSNTIATRSKITVYKMVTVEKVVLSMCNEV